MNTGGLVLIIGGVWLLFQILGGQALQRLGLAANYATNPGKTGP